MAAVPGYEGTVGPGPGQYAEPHVYARDVCSGAGNCVCGGALGDQLHTEAAPGVPVPGDRRPPGDLDVAKAVAEQRFVLGVAYQAGPDPRIQKGQDGGRDYFSAEELEKAAWSFMADGGRQVGIGHLDGTEGAATVVESYVWRGPDWDLGDGIVVKAGDWLIGAILDEPAWDLAKAGRLAGFSPQGVAKRRRPAA